jgi:hypothetical protein
VDDDALSGELLVGIVSEPLVKREEDPGRDVVEVDRRELDDIWVDSGHVGGDEVVQLSGELDTLWEAKKRSRGVLVDRF